jgi:hypothetical protein
MLPYTAHEIARVVAAEAGSALPNAPIHAEGVVQPRPSRLTAPRRWLSLSLRRLADAIEPAPACPPAALSRR